jgi:hypothetical protein
MTKKNKVTMASSSGQASVAGVAGPVIFLVSLALALLGEIVSCATGRTEDRIIVWKLPLQVIPALILCCVHWVAMQLFLRN